MTLKTAQKQLKWMRERHDALREIRWKRKRRNFFLDTHAQFILCIDLFVDSWFRIDVLFINDVSLVEAAQNVHETSAIPVICDTSTIVNMTSGVHKDLINNRMGTKPSRIWKQILPFQSYIMKIVSERFVDLYTSIRLNQYTDKLYSVKEIKYSDD